MAIQIPNPGTGNGATGDNEFVLWSKVKANFENPNHAASKMVGTNAGEVALSEKCKEISLKTLAKPEDNNSDINQFELGQQQNVYLGVNRPNGASTSYYIKSQKVYSSSSRDVWRQWAYGEQESDIWMRTIKLERGAAEYTFDSWAPTTQNKTTYTTTTASGANVVVDSTGRLTRASSSERYKDIIADLELDDEHYADAMSLNPIIYRSKSEIDNPDYHYYSFSAEALGAYDPAFTLWRDTETVTDDEGSTTEQTLDERVAEGINLNAIVAFLHATNIKQGKMIADLEQRLSALEVA